MDWINIRKQLPEKERQFEIKHFGYCNSEYQIIDEGKIDAYGIIGKTKTGHNKRSTITHWRYI